ncbi:DUF3850 domain-containing protein [Flavobacterium sp. FlaQc-50]|uniref:DUF3850 domain-containing protein n=1 Tax=unclassified Flavobacterium TaxID=196869 RepID=UPI003756B073
MVKIHELKTWQKYFVDIFCGLKNFELRKNDRDFKVGDEVLLKEYDAFKREYTGRILHRRIDYILHGGQFGLEEGYVILALSKL